MAELSSLRVLLIEDDDVDAKIVFKSLSQPNNNFEIQHFSSLQEAENLDWGKSKNQFHCIILDYNFPGGVSSNFLHFQKSIFKNNCPIIILTGNESEILQKNMERYPNVYFQNKKDETYKKLSEFIQRVVKNSHITN